MKKVLVCTNCKAENSFYSMNCKSCNAFLRAKIVNIDLWNTLWKILESPVKTAESIIHSEHKNFTITILILAGIKVGISLLAFSNAFLLFDEGILHSFSFIIISAISFIIMLLALSYLITFLNHLLGLDNRYKDNLAIYTYSFLPVILTLMVLSPIQLAVFGVYWFSFNPSPILFKPMASYVMIFLEGLFYVWCLVLLVTSTYAQTNNKSYSVIIGVLMNAVVFAGTYILVKVIY